MRRFWARRRGRPAVAGRPEADTGADWIDVAGLDELRCGRLAVRVAGDRVLVARPPSGQPTVSD